MRRSRSPSLAQYAKISIHAPLAGCDGEATPPPQNRRHFNPRTPCGVRPGYSARGHSPRTDFNPRTPCGVRRPGRTLSTISLDNFNPRTPCGVRHDADLFERFAAKFQSTHPLRGATVTAGEATPPQQFQSTHPLRGATFLQRCAACHARYFNPRTPCGVRRNNTYLYTDIQKFQSTHPLRGATTENVYNALETIRFQSTHPLRGATAKMHKIFCAFCDNRQFYRFSPSGVPSVGALFTYFRGLRRAGAGANLPVNGCALGLRAKSSASPQAGRSACSRSVRFYSRTSCRGNKTAGCRVPDP